MWLICEYYKFVDEVNNLVLRKGNKNQKSSLEKSNYNS